MSILSKIRAFFTFNGESAEVELSSAEIRPGKACLHPLNEEKIVSINANEVDIIINPNADICEEDVNIIKKSVHSVQKKETNNTDSEDKNKESGKNTDEAVNISGESGNVQETVIICDPQIMPQPAYQTLPEKRPVSYYMPVKKKIVFSLYEDEYNMLLENIKINRYQRSEFLLACVAAAKNSRFETSYKRILKEHHKRHQEDLEIAHLAQEEDFIAQQNQESQKQKETSDDT